ncbi:hypothetical protein [Streptomyces natalensis]|uniref:Uncharacterized protein n=1 Tax=Streptomyces natalensis ATCC 27448 TaxID=1240678 RepID=A0A0D7CJR0_9ACTN|nr:hypothetical protein [Streptomyces natalensis]KIZ16281.1 hypothetical protein SNA_24165 [Streptomyces natalensis ATCC 27448]
MGNGTGIPGATGTTGVLALVLRRLRRLRRMSRVPLAAFVAALAFILAGAATAPALAAPAPPAAMGAESAKAAPVADSDADTGGDCDGMEDERGGPWRAARTAVGVPQHSGRPLPPCRTDPTSAPAVVTGPVPDGRTARAAASAGPLELPVLHCVFRC